MSKILPIDAGDRRPPEAPTPAPPLASVLPAELQRIERGFVQEHRPQGPTEWALVRQLAAIAWRLERMPLYEAAWMAILERDAESASKAWTEINRIWRQQSVFMSHFQKILTRLQKLQADRTETGPAAPPDPPAKTAPPPACAAAPSSPVTSPPACFPPVGLVADSGTS